MADIIQLDHISDGDIPNSLRFLADWMDQNPEAISKVIVVTSDGDPSYFPAIYAWGKIENKADIVYNLESAKVSLLTHEGVVNGG